MSEGFSVNEGQPGKDGTPGWAYGEDGYCVCCGNGRWKLHMPGCFLRDLIDAHRQTSSDAMYDKFSVEVGTIPTPLGQRAILRFHFSSSRPSTPDLEPITFVASPDSMRAFGLLTRDAAFRAAKHIDGGRK